jgi:hypothetical protein
MGSIAIPLQGIAFLRTEALTTKIFRCFWNSPYFLGSLEL